MAGVYFCSFPGGGAGGGDCLFLARASEDKMTLSSTLSQSPLLGDHQKALAAVLLFFHGSLVSWPPQSER